MKRVLLWIVLTVGLTAGASSAAFAVQSEIPEADATGRRPADSPDTVHAEREWVHRSGAVVDLGLSAGPREDRLDWNIAGDRNLREAVRRLAACCRVVAVSPVYETAPIGSTEQPSFLNAAAMIETEPWPV